MMSDVAVFIWLIMTFVGLNNIEVQYHSKLNRTFEQSTRCDLAIEATSHVHGKVNKYNVSQNGDENNQPGAEAGRAKSIYWPFGHLI
jgi:hypothetical protein